MDTALEEAIREVDTFLKTLENKAAAVSGTFDLVKNHLTARDEVALRIIDRGLTYIGASPQLLCKQPSQA